MANQVFNFFKQGVMLGSFNMELAAANGNLYIGLVNNSYAAAVDVDNHKYWGDIQGTYEITGAIAYTSPGHVLSSPLVTQNDANNQGVLDASDIVFGESTITAAGAIIFASSGSGIALDPMVCFIDFGADYSSSNGNFTIQWAAGGILALT